VVVVPLQDLTSREDISYSNICPRDSSSNKESQSSLSHYFKILVGTSLTTTMLSLTTSDKVKDVDSYSTNVPAQDSTMVNSVRLQQQPEVVLLKVEVVEIARVTIDPMDANIIPLT